MAEKVSATTTQETPPEPTGPERGSEEWVKQTLAAKGLLQDEESEAAAPKAEAAPPQGGSPEAEVVPAETEVAEQEEAVAAPDWREAVVIPESDESVPKEYRGKPAGKLYEDYQKLLAAGNTQQQRLRELEARVAAKETMEEFLKAAKSQQQQEPVAPSDPYRDAGVDPEVDSVLNPTKFQQVQEQVFLGKAKQMFDEGLEKAKQEQKAADQLKTEQNATLQAIQTVAQERNIPKEEMDGKIGFLLFETSRLHGKPGLFDAAKMIDVYDKTFGAPPAAATKPTPPDPPGAKRPASIDSSKPTGPQLKQYQREAMENAADQLKRAGFTDINNERFAARYAANLKRMKG